MDETSLHKLLKEQKYTPEQELKVRKTVSTSEKGKRYLLQVAAPYESVVYQIDGNIITVGNKCDKMVLIKKEINHWVQILIELKGVDVKSAINQLESTLKNKGLQHKTNEEKRARIVAASFPSNRANPIMEEAKIHFRKTYQCDFRGLKSDQSDKI